MENASTLLQVAGYSPCSCGRLLDEGDLAWNNAATEYGTDYCTVELICQACGREVAEWREWTVIWELGDVLTIIRKAEPFGDRRLKK